MKKLSRICLSLLVMFSVAFSLTACGKKVVESATVSSLSLTVVRGEDLDTSKAVVTAKYKKGGTKTFSGKDLEFGEIDTSELTNQQLSIKIVPENYTFNVTIRVVASEADVCAISQLESELLAEYHANRTNNGKYEKFEHTTEPIYVGTKNPFHFRLKAAGIGADGETLVPTVENVRTVVTVERKLGENNYQLLTGADLDAVVEIDTINAVFHFKNEQATDDLDNPGGAKYRITVTAANPDTDYEEANYSFSAEVVVVKDGFNVYDTIDLSVYDNFNTSANPLQGNSDYDEGYEYAEEGWKPYHDQLQERYGYTNDELDALLHSNLTLIFQDDIELTAQNVRQDFFWDDEDTDYNSYEDASEDVVLGTPHNISQYALFHRTIDNGEKLNVVGNYFAIDASRLPLMVSCEWEGPDSYVDSAKNKGVIAYSALFRTMPTHGQVITNPNTKVEYRNMAYIGNGAISEDVRVAGALLLMKHDEVNFYGYNTTANTFCSTYYFAYGNPNNPNEGNYKIEDCRAFNSYSSLLFFFGAENVDIVGCTFEGAGGPAILAECQEDYSDYAYTLEAYKDFKTEEKILLYPDIYIVESHIEARLSGREGWFTTYTEGKATSAVGQIIELGKALTAEGFFDGKYEATGKTLVVDTKTDGNKVVPRINIQCIIYGDGIIENSEHLQGSINVFNTYEDYEIHYGLNGKTQANKTNQLNLEDPMIARGIVAGGAPVFQCVETGSFRTATPNVPDGVYDATNQDGWTGDYVNLYCPKAFGYMGILLGMYPTTAA